MMKFYFLDQVVENLEKSESLNILSALLFKRYSVHISDAYRCTLQTWHTRMEKTMQFLENNQGMENQARFEKK